VLSALPRAPFFAKYQLSRRYGACAHTQEIETCVEMSIHHGYNLTEACVYAQKALICPSAPVFDAERQVEMLK